MKSPRWQGKSMKSAAPRADEAVCRGKQARKSWNISKDSLPVDALFSTLGPPCTARALESKTWPMP